MRSTEERIRRLHERVANLRREQAHQLTTRLTREFGVIGVEDLNVAGMKRDRHLARSISDAGWGEILRQLEYKTAWTGGLLVAMDRYYPSSKTCAACGTVKAKLGRGERVFTCAACGRVIDRDLNAAINLAGVAYQQALAQGLEHAYVARTKRETLNARGGQVRPVAYDGRRPVKRVDREQRSPRRGNAPALAIQ